ncbi:guanine nucleotide-binding protein subunit beta-like protein 1 [Acanthaster planci]|uniref:Guanine nucleotide-binding protein subunit beta-like protein 1 n=1 Tax=Acanthaster planci TaxID=133434 RepID=A0A8B7XXI3_ACAPL|nr:guanine nucleotide-binding protein subunit beta-like protein 1 [Acanthaster planci]
MHFCQVHVGLMAHQPPHPPDPLFMLRGSKDAVNCVKFYPSADRKKGRLLSGCGCGEVRVWNLETRRADTILDGHDGKSVLWVQPLGNYQILSQGRDGHLLTWDIGQGRHNVTSRLPINGLTFCKCDIFHQGNGKGSPLVAAPGPDFEVCIVDVMSKTVICTLRTDKDVKRFGMPMCIKFIDASRLLVGYEAGQVALWDTNAQKILAHKQFHSEAVMCLDYSTVSERGVSGSADDKLVSWTHSEVSWIFTHQLTGYVSDTYLVILEMVAANNLHLINIQRVNFLVSLKWFLAFRIRLFGWKKLKPLAVLSSHRQTVNAVDFSDSLTAFNSAQLLAAGSKDKHISLWSLYNPS